MSSRALKLQLRAANQTLERQRMMTIRGGHFDTATTSEPEALPRGTSALRSAQPAR